MFSTYIFGRDPHAPLLYGNNTCYQAVAYYPKDELMKILPNNMTIPEDSLMETEFEVESVDGHHPFMMAFCHGWGIHDKFTKLNLPEQEELYPMFPVMYTGPDGVETLMSYAPVLYLNSSIGVVGGTYYGFRKEYKPFMKVKETEKGRDFGVGKILTASFEKDESEAPTNVMPKFFNKIFAVP